LYIVPNPNGPGKTVIRRPHPPPTTIALDEDFDAVTVEDVSTIYRGEGLRYEDSEQESAAVRRDAHADSTEDGNLGLRVGQIEGVLSDLDIGIEGPPGTGTREQDEGRRRDSKVSSLRNSVAEDGRGGRASKGTYSQRIQMVPERVLEDGPGRTVTMWREGFATAGDLNGTQISYEEFCEGDTATETGKPTTKARRNHSSRDLNQKKRKGKGAAAESEGKEIQDMDTTTRSTSFGQHKVSTKNSPNIFGLITVI
jgi:hypothetical protein